MKPLEVPRCLTSRVAEVDENPAGRVLISRKERAAIPAPLQSRLVQCDSLIGFLYETPLAGPGFA